MPTIAQTLETSDNRTTTEVLTTGSGTVAGDLLAIWYAADFFAFADMPNPTSSAGTPELVTSVDAGLNREHIKFYILEVASDGPKDITIPAFGGCDIHGIVHRIPAGAGGTAIVDVFEEAFEGNTVLSHVAPSIVTTGTERLLLCNWMTAGSGTVPGGGYYNVGTMTKLAETAASPFSAMAVAGETVDQGATGTRIATPTQLAHYAAISVALYLPAPPPEPEPEPTPEPGTPGVSGWYTLVDIREEARGVAQDEATRRPAACPNDGTPLQDGPDGVLFCPFDGWRYQ